MKTEKREIAIRDIVNGYVDNEENGCFGYRGLLNIRPAFQREFVYNEKQRNDVIDSIVNDFPLNTFYWGKNADGTYDMIDGQQRTISFCQYVNGDYSIDYKYFKNLSEEQQQQILDYKIYVYICDGSYDEKLKWFNRINIAGEVLTKQELRNAVYTGKWLTDAKIHFSKNNCQAYNIGKNYVKGRTDRQEILETVLDWISDGNIEDYMSKHSQDNDASELWNYFRSVIEWVQNVFRVYRREMKGLNWGRLYNIYKNVEYNPDFIEKDTAALMADEEVQKKSGIYEYLLSGKNPNCERLLNLRAFSSGDMRTVYERQKGICPKCGKHFEIEEMEGDHIIPWSKGGKTTIDNCQMLCKHCNKQLGNNG